MSHVAVNESLFVLNMEEESESFLKIGEKFADGKVVGEERDLGEKFAIYVSEDGQFDILAVTPDLKERWIEDGYLPERVFQKHFDAQGQVDCYVTFAPSSLVLSRLTDVRVYGSPYYAHLVASAFWHTRNNDHEINLRDSILFELYGVLLPTYTLTPKIADYALFRNTLRGQFDAEDLRGISDFEKGKSGLSRTSFKTALQEFNVPCSSITPYFQVGEYIDDFVQMKSQASITGPLALTEQYQIFATDTDVVLLAMSNAWAEKLVECGLLLEMDLKKVQIGREVIKIIALPRAKALEPINDRHFGLQQQDTFEFALAMRRARSKMSRASFKNALYVQALGLILPVDFESGSISEDKAVVREVIEQGPFAQGAFFDDVAVSCQAIVG